MGAHADKDPPATSTYFLLLIVFSPARGAPPSLAAHSLNQSHRAREKGPGSAGTAAGGAVPSL